MALMHPVDLKIMAPEFIAEFGLPEYSTAGAAGLDLRACIDTTMPIEAGDTQLIPTGIAVHIKDPNLAAVILPRSGLGHKKGIVLGNLVGLIDADYQGQLFVSCWNRSNTTYQLNRGDRLAQLAFIPIVQVNFIPVESFDNTLRGEGGFGHTGVK